MMENGIVQSVEDPYTKLILDKGQVRLLNRMGDDLTVVAAARVSNGESYEDASHGEEKDKKLIKYLIKHRHGTPFEHTTFQFYVKAPLFVRSEWHRHRMASYNEVSGRYIEYEPEFYIPRAFRIQAVDNKQGSVFPSREDLIGLVPDDVIWGDVEVDEWDLVLANWVKAQSQHAYEVYRNLIDKGVAKEMARMILPANLYTHFYMTVNARGLMNFLSLRAADDAQWEIRQYALAMRDMFKAVMPFTYEAWENNGYIAP